MDLVSIITPVTEERAHFLPALRKMIADQDYPCIEHILVWDEGTIGYKRNLACERAEGTIILHMDSDDWYGPCWVRRSVESLQSSAAELTGLAALIFYAPASQQAWKYTFGSIPNSWVAGNTMCYTKTLWQRNNFENIQIGEDNVFCTRALIVPHSNIDDFVARVHDDNTSPKQVSSAVFCSIPPRDNCRLMDAT